MIRPRQVPAYAAVALAAAAASARAGTVSYSQSAPTLGPAGISNVVAFGNPAGSNVTEAYNDYGVSHYVAGDNAAKGQTFTTGTASSRGYILSSFTLVTPGYDSGSATYFNLDGTGGTNGTGGTYAFRLVLPSSNTTTFDAGVAVTVLDSETATAATGTYPAQGSTGQYGGPQTYVTFKFSNPLVLSPNTTYGFDVGSDGTYTNGGNFFESLGTSATTFAGGTAYITGNNGVADASNITVSTGSRAFYANLTAVPEPSSVALVGLGVAALLARRRRPA